VSDQTDICMAQVSCPCCFRRESWSVTTPRTIQVHTKGGQRPPSPEHPLAVLEILLDTREHPGQHIVGRCPACDSPLISTEEGIPALDGWTLSTPAGDFEIGDQILGPDGSLSEEEILGQFQHQYRRRWSINIGQSLFTTMLLSSMVVPAFFVFGAFLSVGIFLMYFTNPTPGP
jgi:hypothetical protein